MMTNSKDFCSQSPAECSVFVSLRTHSAERAMLTSQTGGMGFTTKDNGFGLSEKRPRKDERYIPQRGTHIGDSFAQRSFQDCPEAPFRKRVHVCEGEADGLQERSHHNRQNPVVGEASFGMKSSAEFNEGKLSDSEEFGNAPAEIDPEVVPSGVNFQGENNEGMSLNVESKAFANFNQPAPEVDINDLGVPVVRTEEEIVVPEPEITNMDVDGGNRNDEAPVAVRGPLPDGEVVGTLDSRREDPLGIAETDVSEGVEMFEESDKEADLPSSSAGGDHAHAATRAAASSPGSDERSFRGIRRGRLPEQRVEVIEVEDSDDDDVDMGMNVHESDESSTKGKRPITRHAGVHRPGGYPLSTSRSTSGSYSPEDDSDSDDCKIMGYHPPPEDPVLVEEDDDEIESSSDDDSDSDTEVLGAASQGAIRRMWEEAAMRRRMGRAMRSEGSNANGHAEVAIDLDEGTESHDLEESVATSTYRGSPDSKDQTETSEARGGFDGFVRQNDVRPEPVSAHVENAKQAASVPRDTVINPDLNRPGEPKIPATAADFGVPAVNSSPSSNANEIPQPDLTNGVLHVDSDGNGIEDVNVDTRSNSADWESSPIADTGGNENLHFPSGEDEAGDIRSKQRMRSAAADEGTSSAPDEEDLLAAKDKLKQTVHYKNSDAAEWDSRQREIQRQAAETRKLRQRRRQEADRKREMERKQKERIEELRLSQMKEERNMDIREQLRGQVRERLEQIASTCHDYATLLRQLGVVVDGGRFPTVQQVNVAYKKALMKFHPDRAMSSSKGDPRQQVEAEEKFKLILRLKDILAPVPVAHDFMNMNSYRYG